MNKIKHVAHAIHIGRNKPYARISLFTDSIQKKKQWIEDCEPLLQGGDKLNLASGVLELVGGAKIYFIHLVEVERIMGMKLSHALIDDESNFDDNQKWWINDRVKGVAYFTDMPGVEHGIYHGEKFYSK